MLQEEFDAEIIKADEVAHQLMEPGKKGYQHVVEALGDSFLNKDGSIDRKKLAALIFQNKEAVETMNAIIHPMAWEEIRYAINHSDKEIIVVEAALYDDEHNAMFDEIWYVYTSVENRIKRLMASRGYSRKNAGASWQIRHPRTITGALRRVCWTTTAGLRIFGSR
ncbi:MAG: dephospho-CoA kinase [Clostridia bacterium]